VVASFNASAATTHLPNTDYSNERLAFLWNQVGPVATHSVSTTVNPTPEPSLHGPGAFHPLVSSGYSELSFAKLPPNFAWGLSSSAYQIEGAAKDEGRGPSIWDLLSHRVPNMVADNSTGDVVGQHYYLYKQDFARLRNMGTPWFSPSISWPRIFPFGHGAINAAGVKHYDDVINEMIKNGMKPAVTLFHWDTPLALFNEYGVSGHIRDCRVI
jgi:beta-glucosidase